LGFLLNITVKLNEFSQKKETYQKIHELNAQVHTFTIQSELNKFGTTQKFPEKKCHTSAVLFRHVPEDKDYCSITKKLINLPF